MKKINLLFKSLFIISFWIFFCLILINLNPIYAINLNENIQITKTTFKKTEISIITVPKNFKIKTLSSIKNQTLNDFFKDKNHIMAINGGYFNHSNGLSVSFVLSESKIIADPRKNNDLVNNKELKPVIDKILNKRSEFRVIKKDNEFYYDIDFRDVKKDNIFYSIQAGPQLLPNVELEKEGFIIKNKNGQIIRDSISSLSKTSRSAIGIKENGDIIFMSCSGKNGQGLTIQEEADFMKKLGCKKALNLDGGSSVSMMWVENNIKKYFIGKEKTLPYINSAIIVTK
ncbi:MAG: phosphodiester glycosidase family protein [Cyanobacteriota bacterium]